MSDEYQRKTIQRARLSCQNFFSCVHESEGVQRTQDTSTKKLIATFEELCTLVHQTIEDIGRVQSINIKLTDVGRDLAVENLLLSDRLEEQGWIGAFKEINRQEEILSRAQRCGSKLKAAWLDNQEEELRSGREEDESIEGVGTLTCTNVSRGSAAGHPAGGTAV